MPNQSSHLLIIEDDQGVRKLTLGESVYSIGRDVICNIRLFSRFASRRQATLIRQVRDDGSYFYQIVDGDGKGKLSCGGMLINGLKYQVHDLQDGDEIVFNPSARLKYHIKS